MSTIRCGVISADIPGLSPGLACDREPGHSGDHRGYSELIDSAFFWPATTDGLAETERLHSANCRAQEARRQREAFELLDPDVFCQKHGKPLLDGEYGFKASNCEDCDPGDGPTFDDALGQQGDQARAIEEARRLKS